MYVQYLYLSMDPQGNAHSYNIFPSGTSHHAWSFRKFYRQRCAINLPVEHSGTVNPWVGINASLSLTHPTIPGCGQTVLKVRIPNQILLSSNHLTTSYGQGDQAESSPNGHFQVFDITPIHWNFQLSVYAYIPWLKSMTSPKELKLIYCWADQIGTDQKVHHIVEDIETHLPYQWHPQIETKGSKLFASRIYWL